MFSDLWGQFASVIKRQNVIVYSSRCEFFLRRERSMKKGPLEGVHSSLSTCTFYGLGVFTLGY